MSLHLSALKTRQQGQVLSRPNHLAGHQPARWSPCRKKAGCYFHYPSRTMPAVRLLGTRGVPSGTCYSALTREPLSSPNLCKPSLLSRNRNSFRPIVLMETSFPHQNVHKETQVGRCCQYFLAANIPFITNTWCSVTISLLGWLYISPSVQ